MNCFRAFWAFSCSCPSVMAMRLLRASMTRLSLAGAAVVSAHTAAERNCSSGTWRSSRRMGTAAWWVSTRAKVFFIYKQQRMGRKKKNEGDVSFGCGWREWWWHAFCLASKCKRKQNLPRGPAYWHFAFMLAMHTRGLLRQQTFERRDFWRNCGRGRSPIRIMLTAWYSRIDVFWIIIRPGSI